MVRHRALKDKDIEDLLAQLEGGEISEDDAESDGDDLEFYPTLEELQAALEEDEAEEEPASTTEEENLIQEPDFAAVFPDPPLLNEDMPSTGMQDPFIPINAQNLRWRKATFPFCENQIKFKGVTAYPPEIMNLQTPYQFFSYFFTPDMMDKIVNETNLYSVQKKNQNARLLLMTDVRKYFGILIFMSVFHYPSVRSYWDTKYGFEPIKQTMPVNRFEKIREIIHFNNNQQHKPMTHPEHDRLHKLRPVIDHLNEKFSSVPMEQRLSIDEQMCATKIGHFMKQYLPNKPHKWGFKLFVLCSLSGYAYRFIIYSGKDLEPLQPGEADVGVVGNTVIKLSRGIPWKVNHIVYFDNYYTSLPLMYYMAKEGILCLGTVQRNRLGKNCKLPTKPQVMARSVPRGSFDEYITTHDEIDMTAVSWKDNKQVILLSTYVGATPVGTIERYDKNEKTKKPITAQKLLVNITLTWAVSI
ncbi:LOW QUALITY PROTEIN: piggyBac transposable element-derived protein 4-like [Cydia pomonella]|uniref:LOW QUALITY PROTEIN: piggyBac transposable element-derived protein 4-like n=1 Tax=Cydia pomonella TaxID=82600 RepID=UPI002ADE1D5E|nr:LOW QUALITY PROTEIN: piggyBac transposable element-derived protein 4-like [Cydia pomonella]